MGHGDRQLGRLVVDAVTVQERPQVGVTHRTELSARCDGLLDAANHRRGQAIDRTVGQEHEQQRQAWCPLGERLDDSERRRRCLVHVVEHQQQRPGVLVRWCIEAVRHADVVDRGTVDVHDQAGQRRSQLSASRTRWPTDDADLSGPTAGDGPCVTQPRQLRVPPDEGGVGAQRCRQPATLGHERERGVLIEHLTLERAQGRAGFQPERLGEDSSRAVERDERIVLASQGVEAAHEQRPRPLAPGFGGHEPFELRNRRRRGAGEQLGFGEVLCGGQAQLVEADPLGIGEGGTVGVDVRRSAPERQRLLDQGAGASGPMLGKLGAGGLEQGLELHRVNRGRVDVEAVATGDRRDRIAQWGERLPESHDMRLQGLCRARRRVVRPQHVDDRVNRRGSSRTAGQEREQPAPLCAGDVQLPAVARDDERSEDPERRGAAQLCRCGIRRRSHLVAHEAPSSMQPGGRSPPRRSLRTRPLQTARDTRSSMSRLQR